jgi:peptidoglycan/xylan/chitin deacetylase (PgdA/CDA1 family)
VTTHERYEYLPITRRPVYDWPGGSRLAVYLGISHEHVPNVASRDYGQRVGAWRLLDLLYELALPASALLEPAILDDCPELVEAHRMRGDEIVAHGGGDAEREGALPEEAERALIAEATSSLARATGARPQGWRGLRGSESRVTPDLLAEAGYAYLLDGGCDDQPIWMRTRAGRILAVPYPQELDDAAAILGRMLGADAFADMIVDDLDERLRQAEAGPLVMGVALHPCIAGQPHRLKHLRRALRHVLAHKDRIWLATAGAIAAHAAPHAP